MAEGMKMHVREMVLFGECLKPGRKRVGVERGTEERGKHTPVFVLPLVPAQLPLFVLPSAIFPQEKEKRMGELQRADRGFIFGRVCVNANLR